MYEKLQTKIKFELEPLNEDELWAKYNDFTIELKHNKFGKTPG